MGQQFYCSKCRKTLDEKNFYTKKDGTKSDLCKSCETMHVNNFEPDTYLWILEKYDVPYITQEWDVLRDRAYAKDPYKMNGMSVLGRYLAKMKLKQFKKPNLNEWYGWADSAYLQEEYNNKAKLFGKTNDVVKQELEDMRAAYERGEISEAQLATYEEVHKPEPEFIRSSVDGNIYPVNDNPFVEVSLPKMEDSLTEEDKIYLALKWGRLYSAEDWVWLEKKYEDFMNSFDIQGAARIDNLVFICKTSLKMNQALDAGDIDNYQKLARVYDAQCKAAKFTEAQNKEEKGDVFDCVGAIVAFAEAEGGFIPRYYVDEPQDKADLVLEDNKKYLRQLVENDPTISQKIEQYIQKKQNIQEIDEAEQERLENGEDYIEIDDEDYADYLERTERLKEQDKELIESIIDAVDNDVQEEEEKVTRKRKSAKPVFKKKEV